MRLWDHLPSSRACQGGEGEKEDKPQEQPEEKETEESQSCLESSTVESICLPFSAARDQQEWVFKVQEVKSENK